MTDDSCDVLIVGAGLAGLSAAITAHDNGARVIILEKAPIDERGGNTRFSNGAMRAVYSGVEDIDALTGGLTDAEKERADFGHYTREQYFEDMARVTQYRTDMQLADILIDDSRETMLWLREQGVRFLPLYEWQFKLPDGRIRFSGGSAVEINGGGSGASDAMFRAVEKRNITVFYETRATGLLESPEGIAGVRVKCGRVERDIRAASIILACGGFEANAEMRTRYLGPSWDLAKVRGSRFNTGDGIEMALATGAMPYGHWSGCHSSSWDNNAPDVNSLEFGTIFKRDDYLEGIVVNADGKRFFDEGADIRSMTYARLGRAILAQPRQIAWQIFDAHGAGRLHGEYRVRQSARFQAGTLEDLAGQLEGLNVPVFLETVSAFNEAVRDDIPYDPGKKDGRCTKGLAIGKSNWALRIEEPPFEAYAVTCGITFTFGGLRVNETCQVIDRQGDAIPGLFAAGEMVGGLFYFNYPGGSGLMSAAVFGRRAGNHASERRRS